MIRLEQRERGFHHVAGVQDGSSVNPTRAALARLNLVDHDRLAIPGSNNNVTGFLAEFLEGRNGTDRGLRVATEDELNVGVQIQSGPNYFGRLIVLLVV